MRTPSAVLLILLTVTGCGPSRAQLEAEAKAKQEQQEKRVAEARAARLREEAPKVYEQGRAHMHEENWSAAVADFERVAAVDPNFPGLQAQLNIAKQEREAETLTIVGRRGMQILASARPQLVAAPPKLQTKMRELCEGQGDPVCQVLVWSNAGPVAHSLPMSDAELQAQAASYNRNANTGLDCFVLYRNGEALEASRTGTHCE